MTCSVFYSNTNFFTTPLCLAEALGSLKRKWTRKDLDTDEYFAATRSLIVNTSRNRIELDDVGLVNPSIHSEVERLARRHNLDLSDALQLFTLFRGRYSVLARGSASTLITADGKLEAAASSLGVGVWNCRTSAAPPWESKELSRHT